MACDEALSQPDELLCVFGNLVLKAVHLGNAPNGAQHHFGVSGVDIGWRVSAVKRCVGREGVENAVGDGDGSSALLCGDVDHRSAADKLAEQIGSAQLRERGCQYV